MKVISKSELDWHSPRASGAVWPRFGSMAWRHLIGARPLVAPVRSDGSSAHHRRRRAHAPQHLLVIAAPVGAVWKLAYTPRSGLASRCECHDVCRRVRLYLPKLGRFVTGPLTDRPVRAHTHTWATLFTHTPLRVRPGWRLPLRAHTQVTAHGMAVRSGRAVS